jgi:hypothetical protein
MAKSISKQLFSTTLSLLLVIAATPYDSGAQQPATQAATEYSGQGAPLSADELQQLLAPIALYPDSLVAQILGACEGAHAISLGPRQPDEEPQLDFRDGRGVSHSGR